MEDYRTVFALNLNNLMKRKNVNGNDIAKICGVTKQTVSSWRSGTKIPRMDKVQMLADHFGVLKSDLIEKKEPDYYVLDEYEKEIIDTYRLADGRQKMRIGSIVTEIADEIEKKSPICNGEGEVC